jgi:hypothetical protein
MKNYTIQYDYNHNYLYDYNVKYPIYIISYYNIICIIEFIIYNLIGYYDIDITFIVNNRLILKTIYIYFIIISITCLIEIFLSKTMIY